MARRRLQNKRVILTGASSGVGYHLAKRLSQQGVKLIINARRGERLRSVVSEIENNGGGCHLVAGDISEDNIQKQLVDTCLNEFGGIDCLINNAGIGAMGRYEDTDTQRLRRIFAVNFFAMTDLIHSCLPHLKVGDDPMIVNVGSVLGHRAAPLKSEYSASKFAVHGFTDAIRAELASCPVEVLLVSPSTIATEFFESVIEDSTGKSWGESSSMKPDYVARKIIGAMERRRHEIILPFSGKLLVWFDRISPGIADRIIARFGQ